MKKCLLTCLCVACLLAVLGISVSAETPAYFLQVTTEAGEVAMNFFSLVSKAFHTLYEYYCAAFAHFGFFASWGFLPIAIVLGLMAIFGYRMYRPISILCGGLFGFAAGFAVYDLLLAWVNAPAWIATLAPILRWVAAAILALVGILLAFLFRRVGMSVLIAFAVTVILSRYTDYTLFLVGVLIVTFIVSMYAMKYLFIYATAFGCSFALIKLLFGSAGRFPIDLNAILHFNGINAWLIVGVLLGFICLAVQSKMCRGRRYC